jgi:hypothetical protein
MIARRFSGVVRLQRVVAALLANWRNTAGRRQATDAAHGAAFSGLLKHGQEQLFDVVLDLCDRRRRWFSAHGQSSLGGVRFLASR